MNHTIILDMNFNLIRHKIMIILPPAEKLSFFLRTHIKASRSKEPSS